MPRRQSYNQAQICHEEELSIFSVVWGFATYWLVGWTLEKAVDGWKLSDHLRGASVIGRRRVLASVFHSSCPRHGESLTFTTFTALGLFNPQQTRRRAITQGERESRDYGVSLFFSFMCTLATCKRSLGTALIEISLLRSQKFAQWVCFKFSEATAVFKVYQCILFLSRWSERITKYYFPKAGWMRPLNERHRHWHQKWPPVAERGHHVI